MNTQTNNLLIIGTTMRTLMGQAEKASSALFAQAGMDLWPYRRRTVALLLRYARASVEVGKLPPCWAGVLPLASHFLHHA